MSEAIGSERIVVHLLELPVPLAAAAREHFEELLREFALIHAGADRHVAEVPRRLRQMVEALTTRFAGFDDDARDRLEQAVERGKDVIEDHVLVVPPQAGPAATAFEDVLRVADQYCWQGRHLLTLATGSDVVAYRRWYLGEVARQVRGAAATSWPQHGSQISAPVQALLPARGRPTGSWSGAVASVPRASSP